MSVVRAIVVISLLGIVAGGALPGCGQKGPLVQPDAAPKHRKIATPKATPRAPLQVPAPPAAPAESSATSASPASSATPAPTDPQH